MKFFKSLTEYNFSKVFEGVNEDIAAYARKLDPVKYNDEFIKFLLTDIIPPLKEILKKNPGYVIPFAKMYLNDDDMDIETLEELYDKMVNYKDLLNRLPKPVVQYEHYEALYDDLMALIEKQKSKHIANELPSFLKNELKAASPEIQTRFEDLGARLYAREDKNTFIKFVSKYKSLVDLLDSLEAFVGGEFTFPKILSKIEHTDGAELHYKNESTGVIVAKIKTYEASQTLGAPSWCIATNKASWNNYNKDEITIQYFTWCTKLPITDPNFLVGATVPMNFSKIRKFDAICNKNNNTITFKQMVATSGLSTSDYPGPSTEDILDIFSNGSKQDYTLRDIFDNFVSNNRIDIIPKLQEVRPEIGLRASKLPKKITLKTKEELEEFLSYIRPTNEFYGNSTKEDVMKEIIPALLINKGNYESIKTILDNNVKIYTDIFKNNIQSEYYDLLIEYFSKNESDIHYMFNHYMIKGNYDVVDKIQTLRPDIGINGMYLPKNINLDSKEAIDHLLKYVRPNEHGSISYLNSTKDQILNSVLYNLFKEPGNYDKIKNILDYGVKLNGYMLRHIVENDIDEYIELVSDVPVDEDYFDELLGNSLDDISKTLDYAVKRITKDEYITFFTKELKRFIGHEVQYYSEKQMRQRYSNILNIVNEYVTPVFGQQVALKPLEVLTQYIDDKGWKL